VFKKKPKSRTPAPVYLEPYAEAAEVHGEGFGTLLWRSTEGQETRFRVVEELIEPASRVIADLGCGRADLLSFLVRNGVEPAGYIGVDGIPAMVRAGESVIRENGIKRASMVLADFVAETSLFARLVAEFGVTGFVFSGSLNTLEQEQALSLLSRAFDDLPERGVLVFNFLSNRLAEGGLTDTGPAYRFDTLAVLDWALRQTVLVQLRHDYLRGHDATIWMQKP